jgi:beta-lactamase class A
MPRAGSLPALLAGAIGAVWLPMAAAAAEQPRPAKEELLWSRLRDRIGAVERDLDGVLGVSLRDFRSGERIEVRPDEIVPQASSIKLAILYELYRRADAGEVDLDQTTAPPSPRVGGGGVLELMGDRARLTWRDMAVLMMGWSDNDATNALIDRLGMAAVNRRMDELGLGSTRLRRRMMDLEAARRGEENVSTPGEMRRLAEALHAGAGLSAGNASDLKAVASVPKYSAFEVAAPPGVAVLGKTGYLDGVRCWSAVVPLPDRPYSLAVMTTFLRRDADGEAAIREIAAAAHATFDRLARSSELGRGLRD